jgi:hypothetical protein
MAMSTSLVLSGSYIRVEGLRQKTDSEGTFGLFDTEQHTEVFHIYDSQKWHTAIFMTNSKYHATTRLN